MTTLGVAACMMPAMAAPGDMDGVNGVTAADAAIALRGAAGLTAMSSAQTSTGDVAGPAGSPDGRITLLDATRILRAANKLDDLGGGTGGVLAVGKQETVTVSGPTTRNVQLPRGYRISGAVKDTKGQSITTGTAFDGVTGSIGFENAANPAAFPYATAAANTGAYSAVVAAGTNVATISSSVSKFVFEPTFTLISYTLSQNPTPASVVVNADTVQNFVRPDLPATGTVSGDITAPDTLEIGSVSVFLTNGSFAFGTASGDTYSLVSPPGTGAISVGATSLEDENASLTARFGTPGVTVTSGATTTRNITIPSLATVSGTVTSPAGGTVQSMTLSTRFVDAQSNTYTASYGFDAPGAVNNYFLTIPPGGYDLAFGLRAITSGAATTNLTYLQTYTVKAGDTTENFTLPALPALTTLQGKVTGPDGAAVSGATVSATLNQTSGVVTGWQATGSTTTDAGGSYTLRLPAGNYFLTVEPPTP